MGNQSNMWPNGMWPLATWVKGPLIFPDYHPLTWVKLDLGQA